MSENFMFPEGGLSLINAAEEFEGDEDGYIDIKAVEVTEKLERAVDETRKLLDDARRLLVSKNLRISGKLIGCKGEVDKAFESVEAVLNDSVADPRELSGSLKVLATKATLFAAHSDLNNEINGLSGRISEMSKKLTSK